MADDTLTQYGPLAGAFATGVASTWGFVNRFWVPARLRAIESELDLTKKAVAELKEKADKYDALNEKIASAQFAKLE